MTSAVRPHGPSVTRVPSPPMSSVLRSLLVIALAVVAAVLAAARNGVRGARRGAATTSPTRSARSSLPRDRAFAVIGVNGGLSTRANPCLQRAARLGVGVLRRGQRPAAGAALPEHGEPRRQLLDQVTTWPTTGDDALRQLRRHQLVGLLVASTAGSGRRTACCPSSRPAARAARVDSPPSRYTWWLDVETMNSWQSGSRDALARNRATLEGMTAYLVSRGGRVGIYSTNQQWAQIVGTGAGDEHPGRPRQLAGRLDHAWRGRGPPAGGSRSCPAAGSRSPSTCRTTWTATTSAADRSRPRPCRGRRPAARTAGARRGPRPACRPGRRRAS